MIETLVLELSFLWQHDNCHIKRVFFFFSVFPNRNANKNGCVVPQCPIKAS